MNNELWVLDFDRCLGDVDALFDHLLELVAAKGVSRDALAEARKKCEDVGGSFDIMDYCHSTFSDDEYKKLQHDFLAGSENSVFLEKGARELIDWLEATGRPHCILSYGSLKWQELKIRCAGLGAVPHIITSTPRKSDVLREWQQPNGEYCTPVELGRAAYASVVLLDDKAIAFADLPENVRGYWYRHATLLPSQEGEVDEQRVCVIDSLEAIVTRECTMH